MSSASSLVEHKLRKNCLAIKFRSVVATALCLSVTTIVEAKVPPDAGSLATKGNLHVTATDVRLAQFGLLDGEFESLRKNANAYLQQIEDISAWRYGANRVRASIKKGSISARDSKAYDIAVDRAIYLTALTFAERNAREQVNEQLLDARARELYVTSDAPSLYTPLSADVQIILFDPTKHDSAAFQQRLATATAALADSNADFGAVALAYSDDDESKRQGGLIEKLPSSALPKGMANVVFGRLKVGEVTALLPHPQGLLIAKLVRVNAPTKRPFDDALREAGKKRAAQEVGQLAKEQRKQELLAGPPLQLIEGAIKKQLITPDEAAMKAFREIAEQVRTAPGVQNAAPPENPSSNSPPQPNPADPVNKIKQ